MADKPKALFAGLSITDIHYFTLKNPEYNAKLRASDGLISLGGPASNAAITASFLGMDVSLVSPVGNNHLSDLISGELNHYSIHHFDPLQGRSSAALFSSIISNLATSERTIVYYIPENYSRNLPEYTHNFTDTSYNIALFDGFFVDLSVKLARKLKLSHTTTVLDGGSWKQGLEELLPYIDIVICSSDFFPPGTSNSSEVFSSLQQFGIGKIAITQGEKSILLMNNNVLSELRVQTVQAIDTCGAGDILHGAFCYYYTRFGHFEKALKAASDIASYSCRYKGTREWMNQFDNEFK
jgi:sugar/nucleoside kinase (ribokinase family)